MKEFQLVRRQPVALGFRPAGGPPAFDVEAVERVAGLGGRGPQQMDAVHPGAVEARRRCGDDGSAHRPTLTARRRCVSCSTRSASLVYSTDGVLAPPRHRRRAYVWPASMGTPIGNSRRLWRVPTDRRRRRATTRLCFGGPFFEGPTWTRTGGHDDFQSESPSPRTCYESPATRGTHARRNRGGGFAEFAELTAPWAPRSGSVQ